jgi:hypothetical protein
MPALALALLGGAVFLSRHRLGFAVGQYLVIIAGILCLFNVIGYLYGISTAMPIQTSLTLVVLCAGVLLSRPDWGLMSIVHSQAAGLWRGSCCLPHCCPCRDGLVTMARPVRGFWVWLLGWRCTLRSMGAFAFLIWRSDQILNKLILSVPAQSGAAATPTLCLRWSDD